MICFYIIKNCVEKQKRRKKGVLKRRFSFIVVFTILALCLTGCSGTKKESTFKISEEPTKAATATPSSIPTNTLTPTILPTVTLVPTETLTPTMVSSPTIKIQDVEEKNIDEEEIDEEEKVEPTKKPTKKPKPTATEIVEEDVEVEDVEAEDEPSSEWEEYLADDFSQKNSGWPKGQNDNVSVGYAKSGYQITVNTAGYLQPIWNEKIGDFINCRIIVKMKQINLPEDAVSGLIYRYTQEGFYFFVIDNEGNWKNGKFSYETEEPEFFDEGKVKNYKVQKANTLQVDAVDCDFTFYINDIVVSEGISDCEYMVGYVGMIVSTYEEGEAEVLFTEFSVYN